MSNTGVVIPADFDWRNAKSPGLRLVISLVEQLQGTIELDRSKGTTFNITLHEKQSRPFFYQTRNLSGNN